MQNALGFRSERGPRKGVFSGSLITTSLLLTFLPVVAGSSLVTLSCVDRESPKFEMVIVFDALKKRVVVPSDATEVVVNENTVSFVQQRESRFETIIYRSTGRYTVWARDPGTQETISTFGGTCSRKTENKF